jgi:glycogen phosphorylase
MFRTNVGFELGRQFRRELRGDSQQNELGTVLPGQIAGQGRRFERRTRAVYRSKDTLHVAYISRGLAARAPGEPPYDIADVRAQCVFTTHTPAEAGHDRFGYDLFERLLPDFVDLATLKALAGEDRLNMTRLALNLSDYVNGVARRHAETTEHMFPGYRIHAITNGVHVGTWAHPALAALYTANFPQWQHEPEILVRALQLPEEAIWKAHQSAKGDLIQQVKVSTGTVLDRDIPVLGFARRMTGYKRPLLLFEDPDRLIALASRQPVQLVIAGKAHPRDDLGRDAIRRIHELCRALQGKVSCAFLPNYDMQMAATLIAGSDVWLNTPLPPLEASGTSGMKAALNGVLNLSVLDGWWIEACIEGVTGWSIGDGDGIASDQAQAAAALYDKLEVSVLPLYYTDATQWRLMMKQTISNIAYYFNSQRMMRRYAAEAYLR